MRILRWTTFLSLLLLWVSTGYADPGLDASQLAKLKKFGSKVVIPAFVPPGFKVAQVKVDLDPRFGNSYNIIYSGPNRARFTVQGANGGIGDGPDGQPHPFHSPLLGKGQLQWTSPADGMPAGVWSGWLHLPGAEFPVFSLSGSGVDPKVAVKVVESFQLAP